MASSTISTSTIPSPVPTPTAINFNSNSLSSTSTTTTTTCATPPPQRPLPLPPQPHPNSISNTTKSLPFHNTPSTTTGIDPDTANYYLNSPFSSSSSQSTAASPRQATASLDSLISALKARYIATDHRDDPLQFAADFFNQRLAEERSRWLARQLHSSPLDSPTPVLAKSLSVTKPAPKAPKSPAFSKGPGLAKAMSSAGIHSVAEEDETIGSPTSSSFPSSAKNPPKMASSAKPFGDFGDFGNFGNSFNPDVPPQSHQSDDQPPVPTNYNLNRRTSVSAESLTPTSASQDSWTPPNHPKTQDQLARLRQAVSNNFLFTGLAEEQAETVLAALVEKPIPAKDMRVITQGDVGDYFYVIEEGIFHIFVNSSGSMEPGPEGLGTKVAEVGPGGSFGELALMYNAPRAATVVSTGPSTLWALDRICFRRILMDAAFARRRMYEGFLATVPLLESLTPYERSKIADALETVKYQAGIGIINEGEKGEDFFILEDGIAEVYKNSESNCLKTYTKGDYFGELALLNDAPRAASVIAKTDVKVAKLGKDGFARLLGSLEGIMRRNDYALSQGEGLDPFQKT